MLVSIGSEGPLSLLSCFEPSYAWDVLWQIYRGHDVYANLSIRPADLVGWGLTMPLYERLVQRLRPKLVAEVGVNYNSWLVGQQLNSSWPSRWLVGKQLQQLAGWVQCLLLLIGC